LTRTCREGTPGGGGDKDPPSILQEAGEGRDMEVFESSSSDDNPGDRRPLCPEVFT
jgi:hypothetical protein